MSRRVWLVLAACGAAGVVAFWFRVIVPVRRHNEFCREVYAELKTLDEKRPPSITPNQWSHIVAWTKNAHGNTLVASPGIPRAEMDRFLAELRDRLRGPVDLATIDWIWDGFVRLAPGFGPSYSEGWRPTSPAKLREFEAAGPW